MNTSPDSSWFYAVGGDRKGPVPFSELQNLVNQGLAPDSLVWTEGMTEWIPANTVPALVGESQPGQDGSNPYATPASSHAPASLPVEGDYQLPAQPIPLDIGFCIGQGWKHTLARFGTIFLFGFVYLVISLGISFILGLMVVAVEGQPQAPSYEPGQITFESQKGPFGSLMDIVDSLIGIFLSLGAIRWGHRFLNGETPPIGELFGQGSKFIPAVFASILYVIAVFIGLILLIIPGIIIALRLSFFQQAIVEKNLGVIDSLKYSWELTRGNGLSIFGLGILSFLIVLAGAIALLVGLIWALPTVWLAYLIAFRFLHKGPNGIPVLP